MINNALKLKSVRNITMSKISLQKYTHTHRHNHLAWIVYSFHNLRMRSLWFKWSKRKNKKKSHHFSNLLDKVKAIYWTFAFFAICALQGQDLIHLEANISFIIPVILVCLVLVRWGKDAFYHGLFDLREVYLSG